MGVPYILISILYAIGCLALITMILMQKKRSSGLGGMAGMGGGTGQSYWDKNKGRSLEGSLEKYSKIGGALFFIFSLVLCVL
jgi:preprotein translocase subunit SecG